jgi:hypothetical protein
MDQTNLGQPPLEAWQVNQMRLTAFLTPSAQLQDFNWWQVVVGESPEKKIFKPKISSIQEEGLVGLGKLSLIVGPDRADWFYSAYEERDKSPFPSPMLMIGLFPDVLETFLRFMMKWLQLDTCPPIQRIAFGVVSTLPVSSRKTGYQLLSHYLHALQIDPDGSSDLLYQINRPRQTELNLFDKQINRLSKWSVMTYKEGLLQISPSVIQQLPIREEFACRLEIDINTSENIREGLSRVLLPTVYNHLVDLGKEIFINGDVQ